MFFVVAICLSETCSEATVQRKSQSSAGNVESL